MNDDDFSRLIKRSNDDNILGSQLLECFDLSSPFVSRAKILYGKDKNRTTLLLSEVIASMLLHITNDVDEALWILHNINTISRSKIVSIDRKIVK